MFNERLNNNQINSLVLNCKNTFSEIKFLICIHITPSMKFAIFKTQFAKVSSLKTFSHKKILPQGIILTNGKGSYAQKY